MAAITQLLAILGIANSVNLMVWGILVGGIGGLVNLAAAVLAFMAYDKAYTVKEDSTESATNITYATSIMGYVKDEMMWSSLDGLSTELALASVAEEWYMWNMWQANGGEDMEMKGKKDGEMPPPKDGEKPEREFMAQVINFINF